MSEKVPLSENGAAGFSNMIGVSADERSNSDILAEIKSDEKLASVLSPNKSVGVFALQQLRKSAEARKHRVISEFEGTDLDCTMRDKWGAEHDSRMTAVGDKFKAAGRSGEEVRRLMSSAAPRISSAIFEMMRVGIEMQNLDDNGSPAQTTDGGNPA